jgi:hypothetical protein
VIRRITALVVLALLAAAGTAGAAGPVGVVDFEGGRAGAVARLSERTLAPISRPVPLRGYAWGSAVAGDSVAIGVAGGSRVRLAGAYLQLADLRRGRSRGLVRLTRRGGAATAVAWPSRRRVLALVGARADGRSSVVVVDPVARRVLRRAPLAGDVSETASRPSGVVVLAAPRGATGPATLIAIGPSGRPRTIALGPIAAGRGVRPGLAVDAAGRRAWVLAADTSALAEADLASGAVTVRPVLATAAKDEDESVRSAAWLPNGLLAVSGYDFHDRTFTPYGLRLLDPSTGALRVLDARAEQVAAGPGGLLAATPGLRVYDVFGRPRLRLDLGPRIARAEVGRRYAYVSVYRPRHGTYVIDLRSSAVVERLPTAQPPILLGR